MGLFNKNKKDSSLHTLSESEIQKRLYGNLKSSDKTSDTVPHKFKTIPTPEFQATPAASKRETASPLSQEAAYATGAKDDLFSQSDEYSDSVDTRDRKSEESDAAEESISLKEAVHEQSIMSRLAEIAENEKSIEKNKAVNNYPSAGASKGTTGRYDVLDNSFDKSKEKKKESFFSGSAAAIGIGLAAILGVLAGFFRVFDLRSAKVRTTAYWILGAGVLIALFFGVHLLNVQREAAMKSPGKKNPAQQLQSGSKKAVERAVTMVPVAPRVPRADAQEKPVSGVLSSATLQNPAADVSPSQEELSAVIQGAVSETQSNGRYVIQVATYAGPNDANRIKEEFEEAGISVFVKSLTRSSGKIYYSLFLGRFKSYSEAQREFESFKQLDASRPFKDAFIRTLSE